MESIQLYLNLVPALASFAIIAMASSRIGRSANVYHFPLISGYLIAGMIAGPYVLNMINKESVEALRFIDEISLGFIAFAAGAELYLKELRSRIKSIAITSLSFVTVIPAIGTLGMLLLAKSIPFMRDMDFAGQAAIAILTGTILVARSPSSAIAMINELRAKGPFTQTVLGVTMVIDVSVVILFAITSSIANSLINKEAFGFSFLAVIVIGVISSAILGVLLAKIITVVLRFEIKDSLKVLIALALGFSTFIISDQIRHLSHSHMAYEILLEPLLICMVAGFWITNYTKYRAEFSHILGLGSPFIYIAFFTLTGAALQLDVLRDTWLIALGLFIIRVFAIFAASFLGGVAAKDPMHFNRISWATFITQAGVGLGLAKEVGVEYPGWGESFATMIISVIVMSQLVGPPLFKWAVVLVGEAHSKAKHPSFDGQNDLIIFGLERQSNVLARHLQDHGWNVKIACFQSNFLEVSNELSSKDLDIIEFEKIDKKSFKKLGLEHVDAIVCMLSDQDNYEITNFIYENYGLDNVVVRINDGKNIEKFHKLGAVTVDPSTATVNLLSEYVRSPSATSLLLGDSGNQEIIEVEVGDRSLHGVALRNLKLPLDVLVLSIRRKGQKMLVTHGYTKLELGDKVTVIGSSEGLKEVSLKLGDGS